MAQWTNLQQIEKFVNRTRLYIYVTCEKSGGLHLPEPGLMAGWLAGRPSVCPADEIWARLEILKACCRDWPNQFLSFLFVIMIKMKNIPS